MKNKYRKIEVKARKCCFVMQEIIKEKGVEEGRPSGTLTVVMQIIENWDKRDQIVILCNDDFANAALLRTLLKNNSEISINSACNTYSDKKWGIRRSDCSVHNKRIRAAINRLLAPWIILKCIIETALYFKKEKVDVVFSHNGGYPYSNLNLIAAVAGKLAGVKNNILVVHSNPDPISTKRWLFSFVQDRVIAYCAKEIVTVSKATAENLERRRLFGRKVRYIHNGITIRGNENVSDCKGPRWRKEVSGLVMLYLGALHPIKGLDVLFRALGEVEEPWSLVIYGSGDKKYTDAMHALAREFGIESRIWFMGFDQRARDHIKYCDVLVLPSKDYESFGMVLLEAMLYKKPTICTDYGGMKEIVVDGETGIVAKAGSEESLRLAIEFMIRNPARRREMGEAGYKRLVEKFDIKKTVAAYKALLE